MKRLKKPLALLLTLAILVSNLLACVGSDNPMVLTGFTFEGEQGGAVTFSYTGMQKQIGISFAGVTLRDFDSERVAIVYTYYAPDGTQLEQQPTDAGRYKIKATLTSGDISGERQADFVITKKELAITAEDITVAYGVDYTPEYHLTGGEGDILVVVTYDDQEEKPAQPGTYTMKFTVDHKNFGGQASADLVIGARLGELSIRESEAVFDGKSKPVTLHGESSYHKDVEISYLGVEGTVYGASAVAPKNAGKYLVTVQCFTDGQPETIQGFFNILPAQIQLTASDIAIKVGEEILHTVTAQGKDVLDRCSVTYRTAGGVVLDGTPAEAGTYRVDYAIADPNYAGNASAVLTISARTGALRLGALRATFDGQPKAAQIYGLQSYHEVIGIEYAEEAHAFTTDIPCDAGQYFVRAQVRTDGVIELLEGTLQIERRQVQITAENLTIQKGEALIPQYRLSEEKDLQVAVTYYDKAGQLDAVPSQVGSYHAELSIQERNYIGSGSFFIEILPRKGLVAVADTNQNYDGTEKAVSLTGIDPDIHTEIHIFYTGIEGTNYEKQESPPVDAGNYLVEAEWLSDGSRETLSGKLTVQAIQLNITMQSIDFAYGEEITHEIVCAEMDLTDNLYEIRYTASGAETYTLVPPTEIGSYSVSLVLTDSNYRGGAQAEYTISARTGNEPVFRNLNQTYGNVSAVTVQLMEEHEMVSLTYEGMDVAYPQSASVPMQAGRYRVLLTVLTDGTEQEVFEKQLIISQAVVQLRASDISVLAGETYVVEYTPKMYKEETLAVTIRYTGIEGTIYDSDEPPVAAGTYRAVISIADENISGETAVRIQITARTGRITVGNLTTVYNGERQAVSMTLPSFSILKSVAYTDAQQQTFDAQGPSEAGVYAVRIIAETDGVEEILDHTYVIQPKPLQLTAQALDVFCGEPIVHTLTSADITVVPDYSVTYRLPDAEAGSAQTPIVPGTYSVTYNITDGNYDGTAETTLIVRARLGRLTVGGLAHVYDGQPKAAIVDGIENYHSGVTLSYTGVQGTVYPASEQAPSEAGSYMVQLTARADGMEDSYPGYILSIAARSLQLTANPISVFAGEAYAIEYAPKQFAGKDIPVHITYEDEKGNISSEQPDGPGTYQVHITIADSNVSGQASTVLSIRSNAERITLTGGSPVYSASAKPASYTGVNGVTVIVTGLNYTGIEGTDYATSEQAPVDAGTYSVSLFVSEPGNDFVLEAVLEIRKAALSIQETYTVFYTGMPVSVPNLGNWPESDLSLTFPAGTLPTEPGYYDFQLSHSANLILDKQQSQLRIVFDTAFNAFSYGKRYFENAADLATEFRGIAQSSSSLAKDQYNYSRRFKSSHPESTVRFFYQNANEAAKSGFGLVDTRFALQMHIPKDSDQFNYRELRKSNKIVRIGSIDPKTLEGEMVITTDFGSLGYTYGTRKAYGEKWGVEHDGLTGYVIDPLTIKSGKDAIVAPDAQNQYVFQFELNSGAHEVFQRQIGAFSGQTYERFTSLFLTYTLDINGRIIRIRTQDKYVVSAVGMTPEVTSSGIETIAYGTSSYIITENGKIN